MGIMEGEGISKMVGRRGKGDGGSWGNEDVRE